METVPVVVATVAPGPGEPSVLRFDGSDDRVTVPYSPTFPTEVFSFGAWIKLAPPRGGQLFSPEARMTTLSIYRDRFAAPLLLRDSVARSQNSRPLKHRSREAG